MTSLMELLDNVSYSPSISVFGKPKHKSTPGKILGAMAIMTIMAFTVYFIIEEFGRYAMIVISQETSLVNFPINLRETPFAIYLADSFLKPTSTKTHEIRVHKWTANYTSTKDHTIQMSAKEIPLVPCKYEHFDIDETSRRIFRERDWSFFNCIPYDSEDFQISGRYGDPEPYSFINIVVNMCNNKTTNDTCASKDQLEQSLKNTYLIFAYVDNEIDHQNFYTPISSYLRSESLPINWDIHLRYFYSFKNLLYTTDEGLVFENNNVKQNYMYSETDMNVQVRHGSALFPEITIGTLTLTRNSKSNSHFRSFPKIQNLLAKIGGVIQGIQSLCVILAYFLTKNLFLINVINNLFYVENEYKYKNNGNKDNSNNNQTTVNNMNSITSLKQNKEETVTVQQNNFIIPPKIISVKKFQMKKKSQPLKLTFWEKISPNCIRTGPNSLWLFQFNNFLKKKMSYDNILNNMLQIEWLKAVIFDREQLILFDNIPKPYLENYLNKEKEITKLEEIIENNINLGMIVNETTKKLLKFFEE